MADTKLTTRQLPVDTDVTLAANSDEKVASQKATKAFVLANAGGVSESLAIAYAVALG